MLLDEVKRKTVELDEMITINLERKKNRLIFAISILGFFFAGFSFVGEFLGLSLPNIVNDGGYNLYYRWETFALPAFLMLLFGILILFVVTKRRKSGKKGS
jgi:hypothetical protein